MKRKQNNSKIRENILNNNVILGRIKLGEIRTLNQSINHSFNHSFNTNAYIKSADKSHRKNINTEKAVTMLAIVKSG